MAAGRRQGEADVPEALSCIHHRKAGTSLFVGEGQGAGVLETSARCSEGAGRPGERPVLWSEPGQTLTRDLPTNLSTVLLKFSEYFSELCV